MQLNWRKLNWNQKILNLIKLSLINFMQKKSKQHLPEGYNDLKKDISSIIEKSNIKTYQAVGNIIINTLLEMNRGFSFSGRQRKIVIDGQIHNVDLEFYNRELRCIVLVELKTEKFKAEFVGQLNKYISYYLKR